MWLSAHQQTNNSRADIHAGRARALSDFCFLPPLVLLRTFFEESRPAPERCSTMIFHAGFVPGISVERQEIADMIQMREVVEVYSSFDGVEFPATGKRPIRYAHYRTKKATRNAIPRANAHGKPLPLPWAGVWKGPQRVIFGHDAKRGFQRVPFTAQSMGLGVDFRINLGIEDNLG